MSCSCAHRRFLGAGLHLSQLSQFRGPSQRWCWRQSGATGPSPSWRCISRSTRTRSTTGKKQLLDGAVSVFEGGASAEGATDEAQVDLLYRQIGQLKVENDFLARKLGN